MISVSQPVFGDEEIEAVVNAMRRGEISGTFGTSISRFEELFADYCGTKYGVAVSSGTAALQLSIAAAGIGPGDEVLVSACTNVASALAIYHNGALSIPVDSEASSWNLDLDLIEQLITPRTKAIMPVHLYGHPVDMNRLCDIAHQHNLIVIEDCAQSHGAQCREKMTGSFGDMGCFSFYANKIITTGEGGMIVTDQHDVSQKLRLLRNLAFGEPRFYHELAGYNFRMTGYQAAMGCVQVPKIEQIISKKRENAFLYNKYLRQIPGLILPTEIDWGRHVYWMYAIEITPEFGLSRDMLSNFLMKQGIETRTFFCPMNLQPFLRNQPGYKAVPCPVAERLWKCGLYLPSSANLDESVIVRICETIRVARTVSNIH